MRRAVLRSGFSPWQMADAREVYPLTGSWITVLTEALLKKVTVPHT